MRHAFSLVELSIVLVILGLLTGGILAGQSLIRAAELRSISTEYQRYVAAKNSFRDKYFALPGDMANATRFWGDQATGTGACADPVITDGTPGTCNGEGNGAILNNTEVHRYWQHLALAGMIEGSYTGIPGSGAVTEVVPGENAPRGKISNTGWSVYTANHAGNGTYFAMDYGSMMLFGSAVATTITLGSAVSPQDAWNIDTKLDDGMPARGFVMVAGRTSCTNSTGVSDYASTYLVTVSSAACALIFKNAAAL